MLFLKVLVVFLAISSSFAKHELIKLVYDFAKLSPNLRILSFVPCWTKELQNALHQKLESNYHFSIRNSDILQNLPKNHRNMIVADLCCDYFGKIIEKITNFQTIIVNSCQSNATNKYFYPISNNNYLVENIESNFTISRIFTTSNHSTELHKIPIGWWTVELGFHKTHETFNLMKDIIRISYAIDELDTVAHLDDYQYNILTDTMMKLNYAILNHMLLIVNASKLEVFRKKPEQIIMDDLKSGQFDIGGTSLPITAQTLQSFSILGQTAQVQKTFVFRATPHSYTSNVFTLPFDSYVWYSCFALIVIIFIVVYMVVIWEWKDPIFKTYIDPKISLRPSPGDIFLMELGSVAQQGFETEPRSNAGRIVFICTLISCLFLYTSFSANIVALLQSTSESINNFDALIRSRIPVGFEVNTTMDYINNLKYLNSSKEYNMKVGKPHFLTLESGVRRVQDDFFAFYGTAYEIYEYVNQWFFENEKCGFREIPFKNTHMQHAIFTKKDIGSQDILRKSLYSVYERGILKREQKRLLPSKPFCEGAGGSFESVGLADSYGAFLVMGYGILFSVLLLILERIWVIYKCNQNVRFSRFLPDADL